MESNVKKYFKTKEQLDLMTEQEISDKVRYQIVTKSIQFYKDKEALRYMKELELYTFLRFDELKQRFKKWKKQVKTSNDELDLMAMRLSLKIGYKKLFEIHVQSYLKELNNEFQYIKGIKIPKTKLKLV